LTPLGFADAAHLHAQLVALRASPATRALSAPTQARFERLLPQLLDAAAASTAPDACIERLLRLLHAVLRRPAYLALLEEQPQARERLVALFADSALLAERVIAHPLLLDDLLSANLNAPLPDRALLDAEVQRRIAQIDGADTESVIEILQEEKNSAAFRIGMAYRDGLDAVITARALSGTAESILAQTLALAERDLARQHGRLPGLAVIGYGSLGGAELGFASDLDLVFVYDSAQAARESDGAQPLEGVRYFARLAQRVVHWLTAQTRAGKLYEVDVRLRPDGGKGLLVVGLDAFAEYQRERAWIWETQALVRARAIAGDVATIARFSATRADLLAQPRDAQRVLGEVSAMRARWRSERDRSTAAMLDLKQGAGALLDIEFILQMLVLLHARRQPQLLASGNSTQLIAYAGASGVLDAEQAQHLAQAHAALLQRALACTLDARPRLVARDAELDQHTRAVLAIGAALGLTFV
jgi:glutamate-ammonia-ligase adenylyltransferase